LFNQFGFLRIKFREFLKSGIKSDQIVRRNRRRELYLLEIEVHNAPSVALPFVAPCFVNQETTHRFSGGGKEIAAPLP
jgi:hypothetical protein